MADRAFVVALCGIPGSGKSTLTRVLAREPQQHRVVHYDDFQTVTRIPQDQICDWFRRGGDPNEFALTELIAELTRQTQTEAGAKNRPVVLFETPLGRTHRTTGSFIDFLIWIDTPLDIALSRATLTFLGRAPNGGAEFIKWQAKYMQNYPLLRPMYSTQRERVMSNADLVLDGNKPVAESADAVRKALSAHGIQL